MFRLLTFFLVVFLHVTASYAEFQVPEAIESYLTEADWDVLDGFTPEEKAQLELVYAKYIKKIEDKKHGFQTKMQKILPKRLYDRLNRSSQWMNDKGLVESYVRDLEISFFKNPRSFLSKESKGIFVQIGFLLAGGLPGRSRGGKLYSIGVSVTKVKGGGLVVQFYTENLALKKLFTPTFELTSILNAGYESSNVYDEGPLSQEVEISKLQLPFGAVMSVSDDVTQFAFNGSPIAIPPLLTNFTGSKFGGVRKVLFSFKIVNELVKKLPFLNRFHEPAVPSVCRELLL